MSITPSNNLKIFVLNVGQADTSLIITPGGNIIIIDAYQPSKTVNLLQEPGLQKGEVIAHLIITHPHIDHYGAASRLLRDYKVELVTLAPFWHYYVTSGYHSVVNLIHQNDISVRFLSGYERIYPDGGLYPQYATELLLELLGPSNGIMKTLDQAGKLHPNHLSVMARLTWGNFVMVHAADAQMENWAHFDQEGLLEQNCSVLKAAHHGSCRGTQWERLERLGPEYVIVSSDPSIRHHLPDLIGRSIFYKYAQNRVVALTSRVGSIRIMVDIDGNYELSYYEEVRTNNVPLGQESPLTQVSNPTDWKSLVMNNLT